MPDYSTASRTKDHFQDQLLRDYPEIVSIAPRQKLDDQGRATNDAVIIIGVKKINPIRFGAGAAARPQGAPLPTKLPVVTPQGIEDKTQSVEVIIEDEGEIGADQRSVHGIRRPGEVYLLPQDRRELAGSTLSAKLLAAPAE
jgi:hypothetical protein